MRRHLGNFGVGLLSIGFLASWVLIASPAARAEVAPVPMMLAGAPTSADDPTPVQLDSDVYIPDVTPAPAVLLAHGFGGSKSGAAEEAQLLVEAGFVVLAYTARGFGESTGRISMNSPDFEVADARALIDYLGSLASVTTEAPGDPVVGVGGGSYGGALALLLAGYDARVDAVVADITWNDLETSLFAQSAVGGQQPGVLKSLWTSLFFSSGLGLEPGQPVTECGRFTPEWCAAYVDAVTKGVVTAESSALMAASSPRSVNDRIRAPVLITSGQSDSLFPLAQANANAEQIVNAPVKVVWHAGGHDGGISETDRLRALSLSWFDQHLRGGPPVSDAFEVSLVEASALSDRDPGTIDVLSSPTYPGLFGDGTQQMQVGAPPQQVLAPAGGAPAAITSLPGAGGLAGLAGDFLAVPLPGQTAGFFTEPLANSMRIVGSSRARITVSSDRPVDEAVLFASLRTVGANGRQLLPQGLVAPIRIPDLGPDPVTVDIILPTIVTEVAAGDRLALVIATTDQGYRMPPGPAVYTIASDGPLQLPTLNGTTSTVGIAPWVWPIGALVITALVWLIVTILRPRDPARDARPDLTGVPLATLDLAKEFKGGLRAVDGVSFEGPAGGVLGRLGPTGAGKTTTMRMAMGLIRPTSGDTWIFGEHVRPGAPVLARVGSFIEGPGFLPHLTGRQNLDLFWRASGRADGDPHLDEVLEIAGLGSAIDRKVRTYSQGMRQRLGIAQAMLGLPDLLVLDEPTNGLDPPQIREMRQVMHDYAASGKTVIVSSHLLSEVEQTCSHVVVMNHGHLIYSGTVADVLAGRSGLRLEDVFLELVGEGHRVDQ
ncbi:MAG: alpha/beta fold hydrolase [Candidatus Nanopelagicales bacterium]